MHSVCHSFPVAFNCAHTSAVLPLGVVLCVAAEDTTSSMGAVGARHDLPGECFAAHVVVHPSSGRLSSIYLDAVLSTVSSTCCC